jgi:hypothetical protein
MKTILATSLFAAALFALPQMANAEDPAAGAATGAAVGAGVGFAVGGPVGAAVGAGVGGTVGAGEAERRNREYYEEDDAPRVRERECVRDSYGNESCTEIRH